MAGKVEHIWRCYSTDHCGWNGWRSIRRKWLAPQYHDTRLLLPRTTLIMAVDLDFSNLSYLTTMSRIVTTSSVPLKSSVTYHKLEKPCCLFLHIFALVQHRRPSEFATVILIWSVCEQEGCNALNIWLRPGPACLSSCCFMQLLSRPFTVTPPDLRSQRSQYMSRHLGQQTGPNIPEGIGFYRSQ